jgi:hypothetical protein
MGYYDTNEEGTEKWGWRSELISLIKIISFYSLQCNINGDEAKATEVVYKENKNKCMNITEYYIYCFFLLVFSGVLIAQSENDEAMAVPLLNMILSKT